jgi:DNA-directed RNA polymerase specialized sigma24 family protein
MDVAELASPEVPILQARFSGRMSPREGFERFFALYERIVRGWLLVRVAATHAEDLSQDVWTIFYRRWQTWDDRPGLEGAGARPVLSFLFRTCCLVVQGHRRSQAAHPAVPLEEAEDTAPLDAAAAMLSRVQLGECLRTLRDRCSEEEQSIVLAKLAGLAARDIARGLRLSEAVVDHRYRRALARVKSHLTRPSRKEDIDE